MNKLLSFLTVSSFFSSCGSKTSLSFDSNKQIYEKSVNCLLDHFNKLFTSGKEQAVSIYKEDLRIIDNCPDLKGLFDKEPINFVSIGKDSSIYFYSYPSEGFMSKQFILLYFNHRSLQRDKLSTNLTVVKNIDSSWYQVERVVSLAD